MGQITLRPDLKTSGGEISDIVWNGRYVGCLTLVYREHDRLSGSVQLEKDSLRPSDKEQVLDFLQNHVQALIQAMKVKECDVLVTYSTYDLLIATPEFSQDEEPDEDYDWTLDRPRFDDVDPMEVEELEMSDDGRRRLTPVYVDEPAEVGTKPVVYELVIVGEKHNRVEYHVYDQDQTWVAEALLTVHDAQVSGDVHWVLDPEEDEVEAVTELLVSDFDESQIDEFHLLHRYDGEVIESIDLTHDDLLDDEAFEALGAEIADDDEYPAVLARDDGDMLTYEIYKQSLGGLPIGTATVDISRRQLSGFIDFRDLNLAEDLERIAARLMQELDKEKDYDTISLTGIYKNKPVEEIVIESETLH